MGFESVRGYLQLASGLGELTRARATEAAQGLLSLPGVGVATGKVAVQVGALAEELLAAATTNRENLTALVRNEVDAAVTHLGLVPAEKLKESQADAARLRAEVAELRSAATSKASASPTPKAVAKKATAKKATAKKATANKTAGKSTAKKTSATHAGAKPAAVTQAAMTAKTAPEAATTRRSAVTTRHKPAGR